eukprot:m.7674 g.7674  ORF g.7674 m.7674 type:complete len:81 (+) comp19359_c0_seq1:1816-2058(+)
MDGHFNQGMDINRGMGFNREMDINRGMDFSREQGQLGKPMECTESLFDLIHSITIYLLCRTLFLCICNFNCVSWRNLESL